MAASEQCMAALDKATRVRMERVVVVRGLKRGEVRLSEALENPALGTMAAMKLVMALPRVGERLGRRMLARVPVGEQKQLRDMTARQKAALRQAVRELRPGLAFAAE